MKHRGKIPAAEPSLMLLFRAAIFITFVHALWNVVPYSRAFGR